jgi:rubrerythrin
MGIIFNADEIFEMAIYVERNGAKFYRKAAEQTESPDVKKMLLELAVMEDGHEIIFAEMRKDLNEQEKESLTFDPDGQGAKYLQAMVSARAYEGKKDPAEELTGNETPAEIIRIAIQAEKDGVVFYLGMKDLVSNASGKEKVQVIIAEEMGHIKILNEALSAVSK